MGMCTVADPNVNIRYTTTYPQLNRVQINRITGNGTTFDGVLRADSIEPTEKDGTTKFANGDFEALSVGRQLLFQQWYNTHDYGL